MALVLLHTEIMDIRSVRARRISRRLLFAVLALQVVEEVVISMLACHPNSDRIFFKVSGRCKCAQQRPMWFTGVFITYTVFFFPSLAIGHKDKG